MDNHKKYTPEDREDFPPFDQFSGGASVFQVPDGYFEQASNHIMDLIEEDELLTQEAPMLSSIPKQNIFVVPAEYWEQLIQSLRSKLDQADNPFLSLNRWKDSINIKYIGYGVAAAVTLLLLGVWVRYGQSVTNEPASTGIEVALASVPTEELMWEINDHEFSDTDKIARLLAREGIEEAQIGYIPEAWLSKDEIDLFLDDLEVSDIQEEWFE